MLCFTFLDQHLESLHKCKQEQDELKEKLEREEQLRQESEVCVHVLIIFYHGYCVVFLLLMLYYLISSGKPEIVS